MKRLLALALLLAAAPLRADSVFLLDGTEINGTITQQDGSTVVVQLPNGTSRSIQRKNIDTIVREAPRVVAKPAPRIPERVITPTPGSTDSAVTNLENTPRKSPIAATGQAAPPPTTLSAPVGLGQPPKTGLAAPTAPRTPSDIANGAPPGVGTLPAEPVRLNDALRPSDPLRPGDPLKNVPPTPLEVFPSTPQPAASDSGPNATLPRGELPGVVPIAGFPEHTKRMSKRKESLFRDALETIKGTDDALREAAIIDLQGLGPEVVPYCWAGVQDENASVRVACMKVIGNLNGRNCTKRVIETFYMTMPEASQAATWNIPFVRAMKTTIATLTGQSFISVEPKSVGVQDGLKKYIEWYNTNYERLPRQIGEPEIDPTDPDFASKIAEVRKLKLVKREWQRNGGMPVDLISGPNNTTPGRDPLVLPDSAERPVDKQYGDSIPKVSRAAANENDPQPVKDKATVFRRDVDNRTDGSRVSDRDPPIQGRKDPVKGEAPKPADALKRPQDLQREQRGY